MCADGVKGGGGSVREGVTTRAVMYIPPSFGLIRT